MFWIVSLSLVISGFVMVALSVKAKRSNLQRNYFVGVRTKDTMRSERAFSHANRSVWWVYLIQGAFLLCSGVSTAALIFLGGNEILVVINIILSAVFVLILAAIQVVVANRRAREVESL